MNRSRTLVLGALVGAITGLIAASLLNRRAEQTEGGTAITPSDGMKLGVMVFGLLRAIASLGDER